MQDKETRFREKLRNLDLDRPMARPLHYKMACEACVFGRGEHRADCSVTPLLPPIGPQYVPFFDHILQSVGVVQLVAGPYWGNEARTPRNKELGNAIETR